MPEPTLNFSPSPATGEPPPFPAATPLALLGAIEPSLEPADLHLVDHGRVRRRAVPRSFPTSIRESRISTLLPNGPFPLEGASLPYDSYTGDTTHRLYEMWQQSDCNIRNATRHNPSGCLNDLYPFVITNYTSEPDPNSFPVANQVDDNGGGNSMAFYNMQKGDVPVLKHLADEYSMSDNYHQAVMGGTGANHVMMGTGDAIFWSDGQRHSHHAAIAHRESRIRCRARTTSTRWTSISTATSPSAPIPRSPGVKAVRDYLNRCRTTRDRTASAATSTW